MQTKRNCGTCALGLKHEPPSIMVHCTVEHKPHLQTYHCRGWKSRSMTKSQMRSASLMLLAIVGLVALCGLIETFAVWVCCAF